MAENAPVAVIQEAYIRGMPTRAVDDRARTMGIEGEGQVRGPCGEIAERVRDFLTRPREGDWPYRQLAATYRKVRRDERSVSVAHDHRGRRREAP